MGDNIIRCMRFAYRMSKATDTLRMFKNYCFFMAKIVTRTRPDGVFVGTLPVFPELGILCYSVLICLPEQTTIISCMKSMQASLICRYSLSMTSQKPRNPKSCLRAVIKCDLPVLYIHNALC
jgi:hypothetical protein